MKRNKINPKSILRIQPSNKKKKRKKDPVHPKKFTRESSMQYKEETIDRLEMGPSTSRKKNRDKVVTKKISQNVIKGKERYLDSKKYKKLSKWKGILKGYTAFLLGNAPSISKQDLSLLNNYFTIGINRIFFLYEPTVLFWQDRQMWITDKKNLIKCKSVKVCRDLADPRNMFLNFKLGLNPFRFTMKPQQMYGRGNTGAVAAEFAVSMGCSSIVILGIDCKYSKGKTDFYGNNKDHTKYTLNRCKEAMEWLKKKCPIPIYNCSKIDLWPKQNLSDVINEIKPKKCDKKSFAKLIER
ncbi:hypothetical protein LCGC14_2541120 [marine sediment metagenome]|uniref:DUF115 domain-containing protein n=1 Tax=marine sediment metagenome TaxID=412755 RepID=A0A0F9DIS4_9ZZZZ